MSRSARKVDVLSATNKQTNKKANKQANKQTNKQTSPCEDQQERWISRRQRKNVLSTLLVSFLPFGFSVQYYWLQLLPLLLAISFLWLFLCLFVCLFLFVICCFRGGGGGGDDGGGGNRSEHVAAAAAAANCERPVRIWRGSLSL